MTRSFWQMHRCRHQVVDLEQHGLNWGLSHTIDSLPMPQFVSPMKRFAKSTSNKCQLTKRLSKILLTLVGHLHCPNWKSNKQPFQFSPNCQSCGLGLKLDILVKISRAFLRSFLSSYTNRWCVTLAHTIVLPNPPLRLFPTEFPWTKWDSKSSVQNMLDFNCGAKQINPQMYESLIPRFKTCWISVVEQDK